MTRRAGAAEPVYGFGTPATAAQIAAWDIDIGPDGAGLPPGQGTVAEGLEVWERHRCILCHGPTGREGPNDLLTGRIPGDEFPFANDRSLRSTVGNYWPYATTLFDYTRRAMPFDLPGTMTDEEVYAVVGAMLYFNDLLPADAVVDSATVVDTRMPARDRFVPDNRTGGPTIR
ncbi:MAG: cytochrome c [Gemmatimonadales bacterium]|nr:cytochrome c [Gemmatimonadales bacterium]MXX77596.1 cytochrome c [Gemmatimonadales bacterium]MYC87050.1 cytochrome c [Candidatus Palauibacter denitrificans]